MNPNGKHKELFIALEAVSASMALSRLGNVWREVPEKQRQKVLEKWSRNLATMLQYLSVAQTPDKRSARVLTAEVVEQVKQTGGIGRVWYDLSSSQQNRLRRKWNEIFLLNLYSPETESPVKEETNDETKLDAPGNGTVEETIPLRREGAKGNLSSQRLSALAVREIKP